jgi:hypothetical protein
MRLNNWIGEITAVLTPSRRKRSRHRANLKTLGITRSLWNLEPVGKTAHQFSEVADRESFSPLRTSQPVMA